MLEYDNMFVWQLCFHWVHQAWTWSSLEYFPWGGLEAFFPPLPTFLPLLQPKGRVYPSLYPSPGPNMGGLKGSRSILSCIGIHFKPFIFLTFFATLFLSTNLPSRSQHVRFWCPTWPPKRGPNRCFLEFKSQLMLQQPKMSKLVPLWSENLVFALPGPPKTLPNSTKNRS